MTPEKLIVILGLAVLGAALSGLLFHFLTKLQGCGKNSVTVIESVAEVREPIAPSIDPISAMNKKVSELATIQMSMFLDLKAVNQAPRPDLEAFMNDLDDRLKPLLSQDKKPVPEPAATADELAAALSDALSAASQRNASELEKTVAPLLNRLERIEVGDK